MQTLADRGALERAFGTDVERGKRLIRLLEASVVKVRPCPGAGKGAADPEALLVSPGL